MKTDIPTWYAVAKVLVLIQPTSAPMERLFSIIKGGTTPQQACEQPQTREARGMAMFNDEDSR